MTTLYRFYDADGTLLYVGISGDGLRRIQEHAATKAWWPRVATAEVEHHADRASALRAEAELIRTLHPEFNVHHGSARPVVHDYADNGIDAWLCHEGGCQRAVGHEGGHFVPKAAA